MKRELQLLFCGIALICAGYPLASKAQGLTYTMAVPFFTTPYENVDKYAVLDSSYLNLTYRFKFKASETDDKCSNEDNMSLLIGKKYTDYYSTILRNFDKWSTDISKKQLPYMSAQPEWQRYEILRNVSDNTFEINNRIPFSSDVFQYEEKVPVMNWKLTTGTDTVMGYKCKKAVTDFGGRSFVAWYTTDIPISYGPWQFGGLPGLILKIMDTENNFIFECIALNQKPKPIVKYDWKYKKTTKRDWKTFEKNMYEHAGKFVQSIGARVNISDNSEAGHHPLPDTWSVYYDPIEK